MAEYLCEMNKKGGLESYLEVVYANGGGNTTSVYNSSVLDTGENKSTCYYQFGGGGTYSKTFSIQGSDTNASDDWHTVKQTTNTTNRITGITGNTNEYRYYRLHVNSASEGSASNGYRGMICCIKQ